MSALHNFFTHLHISYTHVVIHTNCGSFLNSLSSNFDKVEVTLSSSCTSVVGDLGGEGDTVSVSSCEGGA